MAIVPNSWQPVSTQDVLNEVTPDEQALILNLMRGANNLDKLLSEVVNGVRDQILAGGNQIDQPGLIPNQVRDDVVCLVRWKWLTSVPELKKMQTPERKEAAQKADKRFQSIASRDPNREKIVIPQNPMTTQAPVNAAATVRRGKHVDHFDRLGST